MARPIRTASPGSFTVLLTRRAALGLPLLALAACGDDAVAPAPAPTSVPTQIPTQAPAPVIGSASPAAATPSTPTAVDASPTAAAEATSVADASTSPSAVDILRTASERLAAIQSVRFSLAIDGQTFVDTAGTIELLSATGTLLRPDSVDTEFKVKVLRGLTFSVRMVVLGDERWTTDLVTGAWGEAPVEFDYDPGVIFDTANGLGPVLAVVSDAVRGDDDSVADRPCYRIDALVQQEVIGPLTGGTMQGSPVTVQLWVDQATSDMRRAVLSEPKTIQGRTPASWTLDLFDHGESTTIDRPVVDGA